MSLVLFQLALPLAMLGWLAILPGGPFWLRLLKVAGTGLALMALGRAGLWVWPPWPVLWIYGALWAGLSLRVLLTGRPGGPAWSRRVQAAGGVALLALSVWVFTGSWGNGRPGEGAVADFRFPLRGGPCLVVHGGSTEMFNPHIGTLDAEQPPRSLFRGQSFALDIVGTDRWGFRLSGSDSLWPSHPAPENYRIYGEPVHAACAGEVVAVTDGRPDMAVPERDRESIPGNHVIVGCGGVETVYAHLRRGSVAVEPGQAVDTSTVLGRVGNSGNTTEPHLHFHAQRPSGRDDLLAGEPVWVRFDGHFPERGDTLRAGPDGTLVQ